MASSSDETPYRAPNYFARARGEGYKENTELGSARNLVSFSEAWSEHRSAWKERLKGSGRDSSLTSSSPKRSEKRDALESIDNINVLLTRFRNAMGELGLPDPGPEGAGAPDLVEEGPVVARGGEKRGSLCSETLETLDKLGSALKGVAGGEPDDDVVGGSVTQASSREEEKPGPDAGEGHPPKALTRNQKKRLRRRKKKELLEQDRASSGAEAELSEPGGPSTAGPPGYDLDGYIERRRRWHLASQAFARWRKGLPSGCSPRLVRANTPDPEVLTLRLELEKLLREKSALKVKNVQLARQNENLQELVSYKISVAPQHHFVSRGSPWSSLPSSPRSGTEGAVSKPASPRAAPAEGMRGIVSPIFSDDGKKSPQTPFHPPLLGTPAAEEEVQGGRRGGSAKKFYGSRPPPLISEWIGAARGRCVADFVRMETRLEYDNKKRSLELHATEHFVSDDSVVLTVQGKLNTKTGACEGGLSLRKRFFPEATNRWYTRADLGASYETATDEIRYGAEAKKSFELTADGLLTLDVEGGVQISAARRRTWNGRVEVSQKIFNFTEDQDLKLKVGYDAAKRRPYGQIRENNWTLDTDFRKNWSLKYDL